MIVCENLSKLFNADCGIRNINLEFSPGVIYGIIGYNGAGKTTLLNCIEGLYIPTSGTVSHNGIKTINEKEFLPYRRKIAFLPSDDYLYPYLTCLENIELASIMRTGKSRLPKETEELMRYFEIDKFMNKRFSECSAGMKKKTQIVVSLTGDIDTIVWDEPNDGLDIISNMKVKNLLKNYKSKNVTVLFSCHVIEFLDSFIDHCILIKDGEIAENTAIQNIPSLEKLYLGHLPPDVLTSPF
jgi:ABC-type multidrug transport system ATPase subunit